MYVESLAADIVYVFVSEVQRYRICAVLLRGTAEDWFAGLDILLQVLVRYRTRGCAGTVRVGRTG